MVFGVNDLLPDGIVFGKESLKLIVMKKPSQVTSVFHDLQVHKVTSCLRSE